MIFVPFPPPSVRGSQTFSVRFVLMVAIMDQRSLLASSGMISHEARGRDDSDGDACGALLKNIPWILFSLLSLEEECMLFALPADPGFRCEGCSGNAGPSHFFSPWPRLSLMFCGVEGIV
jgi:hypothetical protein